MLTSISPDGAGYISDEKNSIIFESGNKMNNSRSMESKTLVINSHQQSPFD